MKKFNAILTNIENWTAGTLVLSAALLTFLNVVLRYVFKSPINWAGELIRLMIVWAAFIGSAVALRNHVHIRVGLLVGFLPMKAKRAVITFANTFGLAFSLFCIWQGFALVSRVYEKGQTMIDMGISQMWLYLALPVGCIFLAIRFAELIYKCIFHFEDMIREGGH